MVDAGDSLRKAARCRGMPRVVHGHLRDDGVCVCVVTANEASARGPIRRDDRCWCHRVLSDNTTPRRIALEGGAR